MDALLAKADAIHPLKGSTSKSTSSRGPSSKGKAHHHNQKHAKNEQQQHPDGTYTSIVKNTSLPRSLRAGSPSAPSKKHNHIHNQKLRLRLDREAAHNARTKALVHDAEFLTTALGDDAGLLKAEDALERTWRVTQSEIAGSAGQEAAKGRKEWVLDGGGYCSRYTPNGRHLAIVGRKGHVATFDWQTGALHAELQLRETCRDITFLHDQSHFAVAQKKYVFIYDRDGVELHRLSNHVEPTRLEYLPYHWLLASVGLTGFLKYQDTSTGQIVAEHRTKLGPCQTLAQNPHNAVLHLGHQNGTVTLWTPNLPHPAVRLLAHLGGVTSVSVDPSEVGGRYMATGGSDGTVKVWDCRNWKGAVREWTARGGNAVVEWSAKGALAVATSGSVNVYTRPSIHTPHAAHAPPPLYLTHPIPHRPLTSLRFSPFQDILTVGHSAGLSSILVPGSGEPNFDSLEADPFENKNARREREVKRLLDKIQPDMIALDPEFIGSFAEQPTGDAKNEPDTPFARQPRLQRLRIQGKADVSEIPEEEKEYSGFAGAEEDVNGKSAITNEKREKMKMRGKGKSLKRYLRKQRKNVIDPKAVALRAKMLKDKEKRMKDIKASRGEDDQGPQRSALDRFKRTVV